MSLLEAMAGGLPVVGTDVEGIRDVVRHYKNGLLVPMNDVQTLSSRIRELILDKGLRLSLGNNARCTMEENYSLKKSVKDYEDNMISLL